MEARLFEVTRTTIVNGFNDAKAKGQDYLPDALKQMGVEHLWKETQGEGTVIAVLDTGIDRNHSDLTNNIIGGYNFTSDYSGDVSNYQDNHYHGTHVSGTIAAATNNIGIKGVAPKAKILALKVLKSDGAGSLDWIAQAVNYCVNWQGPNGEKVNIINMSLGTSSYHSGLHSAVQNAVANNIAVIVAAGNEGDGNGTTDEISYPAYFPEVISVGAVDFNQSTTLFSNTNQEIDVCSNGQDILSTYTLNRYAILNGTSMACPHIAGFAALVRGKFKNRFGRFPSESELYELIKFSTVDVDSVGIDSKTGAGYVTAFPYAMKL